MVAHISGDRQHVTICRFPAIPSSRRPSCKTWNSTTGEVSDQDFPVSQGQKFHINSAYSVGGPKCTVTAVQEPDRPGITRMIGIDFPASRPWSTPRWNHRRRVSPDLDTVLGTVSPRRESRRSQGPGAQLVRARDVIGDSESDLARIRRQQVVLSAILRQVTQAGTLLTRASSITSCRPSRRTPSPRTSNLKIWSPSPVRWAASTRRTSRSTRCRLCRARRWTERSTSTRRRRMWSSTTW